MSRRRVAELARGLLAFVGLLVLVIGVPAVLVLGVGWPLPHALPGLADLHRLFSGRYHPTGSFYLRAVAVVAWIAWFEVAACAVAEVRAALSGRRSWRVPLAGPIQPLIASLVAAVVLALPPSGGEAPGHAPSLAVALSAGSPPRRAVLVVDEIGGTGPTHLVDHRAARHRHEELDKPVTVTVRPRDTLWGLAEQYLGNPLDWKEIFDLNVGKPQPAGGSLTDPSIIRVGWVLELPPRAVAHVPRAHRAEPSHRTRPPGSERTSHPSQRVPASHRSAGGNGKRPVPKEPGGRRPEARPHHGQPARAMPPSPGPLVQLPTGAVVSTSFLAGLAAAVAIGRLRRRRSYQPRPPAAGWSGRGWEPPPALARLLRAGSSQPGTDEDRELDEPEATQPSAPPVDVDVPPGRVLVGQRGDAPIVVEIAGGGLGLDGAGAESVARALVADVVTRHLPGHLECVVEARLWPDLLAGADAFPGLRAAATIEDFVREGEVELIRRVRLLEDEELEDLAGYWEAHPGDPVPLLLLVCRRPMASMEGRLCGVLSLGRRVGIAALVLGGGAVPGTTVTVGRNGAVAVSSAPDLEGAQLVHLGPDEATAALVAVSAARRVEDEPVREDPQVVDASPAQEQVDLPASPDDAPVRVQLLGSFRIEVAGEEVRGGIRMKARELLAWFCCHPEGGTPEAVVEALWPEVDPNKVSQRFWNAVTSLRGRLREAAGVAELRVVERYGTRYRLADNDLSADLWDLEQALASGSNEAGDGSAQGLERGASLYSGDLLEDCDWLWVEALRADLRSRVLDALVRLSECAERAGETDRALGLLDRSIAIDPYAEELYQRKLRLQAAAGRPEAVRRTFRELTARLDEIGVDPSEATCRIATVDA
jgi:DNA-binding SARP family transcriptional activator